MATAPFFFLQLPDASQPTRERLEWLTDLTVSLDGSEARVALRAYPRTTYSAAFNFADPQSRALLPSLRGEGSAIVPLFPHAFRTPQTSADAGFAGGISPVQQLGAVSSTGALTQYASNSVPSGEVGGFKWVAPLALATLSDARSLEHATSTIASASLTFDLVEHDEQVPAYTGPTSLDYLLFPARHNWVERSTENLAATVSAADLGQLRLRSWRYSKRSVGVSLLLKTRAEVLAFRQFLFAIKGRAVPFRWAFPGDGNERTWRLNQDAVELEYLTRSTVRCSLELTQLSDD